MADSILTRFLDRLGGQDPVQAEDLLFDCEEERDLFLPLSKQRDGAQVNGYFGNRVSMNQNIGPPKQTLPPSAKPPPAKSATQASSPAPGPGAPPPVTPPSPTMARRPMAAAVASPKPPPKSAASSPPSSGGEAQAQTTAATAPTANTADKSLAAD